GLERLGHDEQLGKILVLELLVEGQIEARRTLADEARNVSDIRILQEALLEPLCILLRLGKGGAFREPKVDQNLRPVGGGEELLGDESKAADAGDERDKR